VILPGRVILFHMQRDVSGTGQVVRKQGGVFLDNAIAASTCGPPMRHNSRDTSQTTLLAEMEETHPTAPPNPGTTSPQNGELETKVLFHLERVRVQLEKQHSRFSTVDLRHFPDKK
jgi:hypothetical protein